MRFLPLLVIFTAACDLTESADTSGDDTSAAALDCDEAPVVTWASWGESFFETWCQSCHSVETPQRSGAPEAINFDLPQEVTDQSAAIRRSVLDNETMPKGGGLGETERVLLDVLLQCGM
jgi:hypothetical protein